MKFDTPSPLGAPMPAVTFGPCVLLPLNIRTLPILRDGKPEVLDLEVVRIDNDLARQEGSIPDPWEDRK